MVELNHRDRQIKVKIVYYGPPVGGKTTNLQILHQHAETPRRGEMISINSAQDRTILFDLLPLRSAGFRGFDLRLQVLAVPGQAMYATTRRLVLKNADSLVFVANSARDRWEENLQSFREMTQNLLAHRLDPAAMPLVFQYNKRDLPEVMDVDFMDRALNARKVDSIPAVAVRGEGVLETFSAILMRTIQDLAKRYSILDSAKGQPAWQWTQQAVLSMFGATTLAPEAQVLPDEPQPRNPPVSTATPFLTSPSAPPLPSPPTAPPASRSAPPLPRSAAPPLAPPPVVTAPMAPPAPAAVPPSALPPPAVTAPIAGPGSPSALPAPPVVPPFVAAPAAAAPPAAGPPAAPPAPALPRTSDTRPVRTVVRVAPQVEESGRGAAPQGPDARANETLVESYAEASAQLGAALNDLREERDLARSQVSDLEAMLAAAQEILAGKPLDDTLSAVLGRMAAVAGTAYASFLLPDGPHRLKAAALQGLREDPLLGLAAAVRHVLEATAHHTKPRFHEVADNLDVGQALDRGAQPMSALLSVPVRTPRGLQGLGALYFTHDAARPGDDTLAHLGSMARVLSATLELAATLETVRASERALEMALAGTASSKGLEDVVGSLLDLRERLSLMRGRPGAPPWFVEEFANLAPSLSNALQAGRSLLAFSKGEIQQDTIYLDDLFGEVRSDFVSVQRSPGAEAVWGDTALVRLALRTLVDHVRGGSPDTPIEIRVTPAPGKVLFAVGLGAAAQRTTPRAAAATGLGLGVVQRVAELHGGALNTESVPGEEDWIVLSLPAR
jgi:signal recognition particle receptor subunit beta/signal transduction histidine kinase